ncbi:uncharacterized protein EAF02_004840 [Botrytis sinoallii]|uniref:uncharacterized protein n=1 Tax=Botrytis sinoallii TaxID=1463999 RepID=UPI001901EF80|nr:uncharacterized protein EAF02_004840 [Botrytis sinoallii]KAF7884504.1 hypothetical protein EAF02_004840 [Botrytis sinoallii]
MPPRKSDVAKPVVGDETTPVKETTVVREGISIEDLSLPKSIVTRLAKSVLPPNTQIQGNAMLAMGKSATIFVNYLATHANENAHSRSVKTIAPQDVFKALDDIEFPDFKPRLEAELAKFIELQSDKRNTNRKKVAADKVAGSQAGGEDGEGDSEMLDREGDGEPKAKKVRRDGSSGETQEEHDDEIDADEEHDEEVEGEEGEDEEEGEGEAREDDDEEEKFDVEEAEEKEVDDEALDNGEDSD